MVVVTEKRLVTVICAFITFAFVVELKLVAIMCSDYYLKAENQTVKSIDISTGRADIVDCNLKKITGTENQIKALITPQTDLQAVFENIRGQDREKFYNMLQNQSKVVVNLMNPIQSDTIYTASKRYSKNNIAQNVIGYLDIDENGIAGIERAYNDILKDNGKKFTLYFNVNGDGDIYGDVYSELSENSKVLSLTIDNSLQRMCESIAIEYITNGSIVVLESKTGKIKAMVSTPTYDANNIRSYLEADNSPLVNKALQSYEPGSVIKPLWAAALLEENFDKDSIYVCKGYTEVNGHVYHCANNTAHGEINMQQALTVSCNCYFIDRKIKNKGLIYKQMANQMNIGTALKLCDNYYTTQGTFPTVSELANMGTLSSVSFGQGNFLTTPVHIAAYMNMFANLGVYVYPQIVQGVYDEKSGELLENLYQYNSKKVISQRTALLVKDMLVNVVDQGAHSRAKPRYFTAAGKTGTAQTGKKKEKGEEIFTAWFCGFYPAENPQYTICITMYDGGESTQTAAPLFKKICDEIYYLEYVGIRQ